MKRFFTGLSLGSLFLGSVILLHPSAALGAAVAVVQKVSNTTLGAASLAATLPQAVTGGNLIVVTVAGWSAPASQSVTDTRGNAYALAGTVIKSSSNEFSAIYYAKNAAAGADTVTFTAPTSGQYSMTVAEFSGIDTVSPLDGAANASGSSAAPSAGPLTPSVAGDLVIGSGTHSKTTVTTAGAGFTILDIATEDDNSHQALAAEYKVQPSTAAVTAPFSTAISSAWIQNIALFKPAVALPPDTTAPTVSLTNPADGAVVSGIVSVTASSSDNVGVVGVQFLVDGSKIGVEDTTAPYAVNWNSASSTNNAPHTLLAVARDAAGNRATSTPVQVGVNNPVKLVILQPVQNATIASTTVNIVYTETGDTSGVDGVRFQLDNGPIMQDPTYDGTFQLTNVAPGTHMLMGFLTQIQMMVPGSDADMVTFTTTGPDVIPPTVSITSPAASSTLSGTVALAASASDNVGVTGVQFMIDGTNYGAKDTAAPYTLNWDTTLVADGVHTITAVATDAALNTTTSAPVSITVSNASLTDPAHIGQWSAPVATPMVLVHGTLLKTGKLLVWAAGNQARLFDPATGGYTQVPDNITDLLCAGEVVLTNGNLLSVGGEGFGPPTKKVDMFSIANSTWSAMAPMNVARWYPTATVLPDGRVLSTAGAATGGGYAPIPEIYNPKTNVWTMMNNSASNSNTPNYPFMYVLPDGRVAFVGASEYDTLTQILDLNTQTWSTVDSTVLPGASSVMYQPGKIMKAGEAADSGFSGPATSTTYVIDFNQASPAWHKASNMAYPRSFMNLATLPDGTVLVTGGETTKDGSNVANAVKAAELWNPATETWTTMASAARPRLYHSIDLLLPDGRVFVSGGGNDAGVPDEMTSEYYSPGYLFKGARPVITSAPSTVQYGSQFFVATPDAASIASVSLVKASAITHYTDMEQRFMNLNFTQTAGGITINAPANPNFATPGIYMLFIVNSNGVPSIAPFVTLPSSFDDSVAPSAPTNLAGTGSIGSANLSWTASTDNVGVANYNVHRSTVAGFTPSLANRIAQPTTTAYVDSGLPAGTYYYAVTAQDAAANVSAASNQISVSVTSDTQAPSVSMTAPLDGATVSGNVTVSANASDNVALTNVQFKLDGANLGTADTSAPYQVSWDTTGTANGPHTLTAVARDTSGNVATSSPVSVTVNNVAPPPSPLAIDKTVFKDQTTGTALTTAAFSTASSSELLLAFVSADGGSPNTTVTKITTTGLVWVLVSRTNTQLGTAEVWRAFATSTLTNVTVAATLSRSTASSITVMSFTGSAGAGTGGAGAIGATLSANAASGAPTGTIVTTRNNSWIFGVGTDYDTATSRTVGSNQTMVHQYLPSVGDTYWVQRQNASTPLAGTSVTINDTAPTTDRYNLSIVEVLAQ